MRIEITSTPFDPNAELARLADGRGGAGALASFVGYCRDVAGGGLVERLELEHYPGFTETEIARLAESVARAHKLENLLIIHRVGDIPARDPIVLVAALSAHRAAAFAAVEQVMDYLKTAAPIWKREITAAGARWIEPTDDDLARRESRKHG